MMISVITVCRNAASVIEGAVRSVAEQTCDGVEYLVIDGGSEDGTLAVLEPWRDHIDVLVSERDGGIYDAMNKGIRKARGDWIIFLGADDYFCTPHSLQLLADFIALNRDADVVYGGIEVRMAGGAVHAFMPPPPEQAIEFLISGSLPHQATLARRGVFARTGLFDDRLRTHADYDWFLKVATDDRIKMVRAPIFVGSFSLGGASSNLECGERERHVIQNAIPLLQTETWLRRRIEIYQEIYLRQRMQLEAANRA